MKSAGQLLSSLQRHHVVVPGHRNQRWSDDLGYRRPSPILNRPEVVQPRRGKGPQQWGLGALLSVLDVGAFLFKIGSNPLKPGNAAGPSQKPHQRGAKAHRRRKQGQSRRQAGMSSGDDQGQQRAHREPGDEAPGGGGELEQRALTGFFPVEVTDTIERFRGAPVSWQQNASDEVAVAGEYVAQGSDVPGASGESVDQQAGGRSLAEMEGRRFVWIQRELTRHF